MKIVFSYYFHNEPLYFSYSQREYLSSQINISNPFFHRLYVGGFLLYRNKLTILLTFYSCLNNGDYPPKLVVRYLK